MKERIELGQIFCGEYSENCEVDRMSCPFSDCMAEVWAEKILSLGYHKTVWHKVAENDLPTRQGQKVWLCTISKDYFMANYYDDTPLGGKQFFEIPNAGRITLSNVLAWAQLPKYEE